MKNWVVVLLLVCSSAFSQVLEIEKDPLFKSILEEFEKPGTHMVLYQEAENYRIDLTLIDLVDSITNITLSKPFNKYYEQLRRSYIKAGVDFGSWYKDVQKIALKDAAFKLKLDQKLQIQIYNHKAQALLPEYKFIDLKRIKDLGLLRRLNQYNEVTLDAESTGLLAAIYKIDITPYYTKGLTVSKYKHLKKRIIKKVRKAYYTVYNNLLSKQTQKDQLILKTQNKIVFKIRKKNGSKAKFKYESDGEDDDPNDLKKDTLKKSMKLFNLIHELPHKNQVLSYMKLAFAEDNITIPKKNGHILMTPFFIHSYWDDVINYLKEFSLEYRLTSQDDDLLIVIRRWVKKNYELVKKKAGAINAQLKLEAGKLPSRLTTISSLNLLEQLFPTRPWFSEKFLSLQPEFIKSNGKKKYLGKKKFARKIKQSIKNFFKVESLSGLVAGTAVFIATSGNASLVLSSRNLVKNAVATLKHDREWDEFLKQAPKQVLMGFLLGSGFSSGRLYKVIALGAGLGALQSVTTGQDIYTGALVGAGLNLVNYYLLPIKWAKPMTQGFDATSLAKNRWLELTHSTVRSSVQGSLVAVFTGEDPLTGALKGGAFGAVSSALAIWFLGTRYFPFKDYDAADVDAMIDAENAFQNDVGRGGEYVIDRQMIMDANFRVNGALPKIISASITLPGNVSMSDGGFTRLTTLTHEAHHLMQQHQSGVYGFYLFRYIPTSIFTGYNGHPDENFLSRFLSEYLAKN